MNSKGETIAQIELPCGIITNCCFGGDDLRTLFVTTGTLSMSAAEKAANPLACGLFAAQMDIPGLPGWKTGWPRQVKIDQS